MVERGTAPGPEWLEAQGDVAELPGTRVLLRRWFERDLEPFAELNADPRVMEYFPSPLTRAQSDGFVRERILPLFAKRGFGSWAVEVPGVAPFIGYVGFLEHTFDAPFTPCIEIGWRLARAAWGNGYATEAARIAVAFGFDHGKLDEIVSFTVPANARSIAVMSEGRRGGCRPRRAVRSTRHRASRRHPLRRRTGRGSAGCPSSSSG